MVVSGESGSVTASTISDHYQEEREVGWRKEVSIIQFNSLKYLAFCYEIKHAGICFQSSFHFQIPRRAVVIMENFCFVFLSPSHPLGYIGSHQRETLTLKNKKKGESK